MPANKINYMVVFKNDSQLYGTMKKEIALETPPPEGVPLEDKFVFFVTHNPDTGDIYVHPVPREEVLNADIKQKKIIKKETDV